MKIPTHIGIIMDGNGRWAKKIGKPRSFGHIEGSENLDKIARVAGDLNVKYLSVYAFSTENWKRSKSEVAFLMKLLREYIKKKLPILMENNIRLRFSGSRENISKKLLDEIVQAEEKTKENSGLQLIILFNYGGRKEIVDAVNKALIKNLFNEVCEEDITKNLYCPDIPDPELIIRTSGEFRTSNFLPWQSVYSEYVISNKFWPEFTEKDLISAITEYNGRNRRFGGSDE